MRGLVALIFLVACNPQQVAHEQPLDITAAKAVDLNAQDRDFLERAAQGNQAEVSIGALAPGRGLDPAVIAFGRMMTSDHAAAYTRLAAVAQHRNIALPTSLGEHQAAFDRLASLHRERFDEEFGRVMIEDHQRAVELYKGEVQNGTDPLLKAYAAETLPVIEHHLAMAKQLPRR